MGDITRTHKTRRKVWMADRMLSIDEAAKAVWRTPAEVRAAMHNGDLVGVRKGWRVVVPEGEVKMFVHLYRQDHPDRIMHPEQAAAYLGVPVPTVLSEVRRDERLLPPGYHPICASGVAEYAAGQRVGDWEAGD